MNIQWRTNTIAVVAQDHNASILHPGFLTSQGIVPKDWKAVETISTQPFARVAYENGIEFQIDPTRFQVLDKEPLPNRSETKAHDLAGLYLKELPHVPYRAIGMNALVFVSVPTPSEFLVNRFVREGGWNDGDPQLAAANLRFIYQLDDTRLGISITSGRTPEGAKGIFLDANYHFDLPKEDPVNAALAILEGYPHRLEHFEHLTLKIMS